MSSAARQQRHRERRRNGRMILHIECDDTATPAMLVIAGLLDESDEDNIEKVTAAMERQVELLCEAARQEAERA